MDNDVTKNLTNQLGKLSVMKRSKFISGCVYNKNESRAYTLTMLAYSPQRGTTSMVRPYKPSGRNAISGLLTDILNEARVINNTNTSTIDLKKKTVCIKMKFEKKKCT